MAASNEMEIPSSQDMSASALATASTSNTSSLKSILKTSSNVLEASSVASASSSSEVATKKEPADLPSIREKINRVQTLISRRKAWLHHRNNHLNLKISSKSSVDRQEHRDQVIRADRELKMCNEELNEARHHVLTSNVQSKEAKELIFQMISDLKHDATENIYLCYDSSESYFYREEHEYINMMWKKMYQTKTKIAQEEWSQIPMPLEDRERKVQIHAQEKLDIFIYEPENSSGKTFWRRRK